MKRGTKVKSDGILLPDAVKIKSLDERGSYKYLGGVSETSVESARVKTKQ